MFMETSDHRNHAAIASQVGDATVAENVEFLTKTLSRCNSDVIPAGSCERGILLKG